jgi:hypothetical protein
VQQTASYEKWTDSPYYYVSKLTQGFKLLYSILHVVDPVFIAFGALCVIVPIIKELELDFREQIHKYMQRFSGARYLLLLAGKMFCFYSHIRVRYIDGSLDTMATIAQCIQCN